MAMVIFNDGDGENDGEGPHPYSKRLRAVDCWSHNKATKIIEWAPTMRQSHKRIVTLVSNITIVYKKNLLYHFKSKLKCRGDILEFQVTKFDFSLDSFDVHNKCQFYDETFANKKGNPRYSSHILESLSKYYGTASSSFREKPRKFENFRYCQASFIIQICFKWKKIFWRILFYCANKRGGAWMFRPVL